MKTLTVVDNNTVTIDGVEYIRKEKTLQGEPKFKVGDWYYDINGEFTDITPRVVRITRIDDDGIWSDDYVGDSRLPESSFSEYYRLATPAEIESHLRKVAKEKGFKNGASYKHICEGTRCVLMNFDGLSYSDSLEILTDGRGGSIYDDGKWAEILPDKKPVPKTKEDFNALMKDWLNDDSFVFTNDNEDEWSGEIDKWLDQYDFED